MDFTPLSLDHCIPWAELLALSFERTVDETAQVLMWLHEQYRVTAWGAWEGDQLAAQYACLRRKVLIGDVPFETGMSLNMSVHPEFRGRGLIKQVAHPVYETLQAEGVMLGVGFSNAAGVQVDRHSRSYGYRVVGQMISTFAYLKPLPSCPALTLSETLPDTEWDVGDGELIRFEMTAGSIAHRYAHHPFRRYHYGLWQENGALLGVVIYRPLRNRHAVGLLAAYGRDLDKLLARWSSALRASRVRFVHSLATPNARLRAALARISISMVSPYSRSPYTLTVKPLHASAPAALLDFAAWDCGGGDIL